MLFSFVVEFYATFSELIQFTEGWNVLMLVQWIWQICTAGIGRRGELSFLASLCCVDVAETHPCLHHRTGTRRFVDPPALAFIPSLALLPSALVSAYHPVIPQKAELWQYRIPEPFNIGKSYSLRCREQWLPKPWVFTNNNFASGRQVPRSMCIIPCKWTYGNVLKMRKDLWVENKGKEKEHSKYKTKFLAEI